MLTEYYMCPNTLEYSAINNMRQNDFRKSEIDTKLESLMFLWYLWNTCTEGTQTTFEILQHQNSQVLITNLLIDI